MNLKEKFNEYSKIVVENGAINPDLYGKYEVKKGLRDISGKGVLAGLTDISEIRAYIIDDNELVPCEGKLFYRGYNIEDIIAGFLKGNRFGFEEVCYLLMMGKFPNKEEYNEFRNVLAENRCLPDGFVRDTIMNAPSSDIMNSISKSILTLYSYDKDADDISIANVIRQSIELIAKFPLLAVYGYQSYVHKCQNKSLIIHSPEENLSTAENILRMLRPTSEYTELEAKILDLALVLHAEHGGGNNSTFTNHVVTSSGTDTYSATVASLSSLKGPKHGGANIKVVQMFEDIKKRVKNWDDEDEIAGYVRKILDKKAFDKSGLVYGIGHAVYSLSDPRALIFKDYVKKLAIGNDMLDEYLLFEKVERIAPLVISRVRNMYKGVSANIDFYSGFVYKMLKLPEELYTPMFAVARIAGWSAHRIEELVNAGKIIRPAYKSVSGHHNYVDMDER